MLAAATRELEKILIYEIGRQGLRARNTSPNSMLYGQDFDDGCCELATRKYVITHSCLSWIPHISCCCTSLLETSSQGTRKLGSTGI